MPPKGIFFVSAYTKTRLGTGFFPRAVVYNADPKAYCFVPLYIYIAPACAAESKFPLGRKVKNAVNAKGKLLKMNL